MNILLRSRLLPSVLAVVACLSAATAQAATFTVSNTNDTGAGSLRQAITDALAGGAGPHDIQAGGVTGTISLQSALPVITNTNLRIHGPTTGTLTVTRGTGTFRIFTVNNSGGAATLTVSRLSMTNGSDGTMGGCILVSDATMNLNYCTVSGGNATSFGGGIAISGNVASTVNIAFSTISGNTCGNGQGAGISSNSPAEGGLHTLNITHSTLSGNHCTGSAGGGLFVNRTLATLRNCTISGNRAGFNAGGISVGSTNVTLNLINCTVANNTADTGNGGGIRGSGSGGSVANLINTLVVGNVLTGTGANDTSWGSSTRTAKNSVVGVNASNAFDTVTASEIGTSVSPKVVNLGPLADNGGPTQTHALLATTPELAINLGSNSDAINLPSDQRGTGYDRIMGGTVDIGAFETGTAAPTLTGVAPLGAPAVSHGAGLLTLSNFIAPPGTDRLLVVVASDSQSTDVTGVSFGGTAMTQAVERNDTFAVDSIWVLPLGTATAATAGNIVVTRAAPGDRTFIAAQVFQNVNQTTPVSATDSFEPASNVTSVSRSIASAAGDLVFDVLDSYRGASMPTQAPAVSNGQALVHASGIALGFGFGYYTTSLKPGAASVDMSWTTSSEDTIYLAVNLKQASASASAPTVTTATQSGVTHNSATLGGNVTADGGATVTERGIVWGLSADPTTSNNKVQIGSGTGAFSQLVTGLPASTTVHVRAYAINTAGTAYGSNISFATSAAPVAVSSLNRANATPSNAGTVNWTLTFASAVSGVTASNFSLSGAAAAGASVGTPSTGNGGISWTVPVTTAGTDGTLTLSLANATGLSAPVSDTLPYAGQSYTMDKTPPQVLSVSRLTPAGQQTASTTVVFRVTYSEPVVLNAPETARFQVVAVGGSDITGTVASVSGTGDTRDVTVNLTGGTGEFRLRVRD